MEARRANKVYQIDTEREADAYAARGYDIYDGGKLVRHALGKTVPIADYENLMAENRMLREQLAALGHEPVQPQHAKRKGGRPTKAELLEEAAALGIDVPEGATNPEIAALIGQA